jgi:hypothetical protein
VPNSAKRRILSVATHDEQVARLRSVKSDVPRLRFHSVGYEFGDRGTPLHRRLDVDACDAEFAASAGIAEADKRRTPRRRP